MAHPEVRKVGMQAVTKAGSMVSERLANRKAVEDDQDQETDIDPDIVALREAFDALPTRHELAEAIAALDEQAEIRAKRLRWLVVGGIVLQAVILGGLIVIF
ncbi:MAG: hypothetical protein HKN78_07350 [Sphingomonadaceae bacterium]|nr:hypothetical protein [Sphingomonadaceae bacterium]